jgi:TP901 family phage tail tape measure protein
MALLVGELYALLKLEKKAFMVGLAQAEAASKAASGSIASSFLGAGKIIALGLAAAVVGLAAFGGAAIGASTEFEKGMANVQTLIGTGSAVDARIEQLGESVKQMSMTTGKSLKDLTRGLYDVIGTFTDTADSAKWLEIAAKAGAAGMSTTHDAILLLSAVTKAYGDTSFEAAQKASDLIFETANLGVTTFPEMAASMGKVLPIAAALKVSQEELFGAMATLTGVTGDTALVTTQLRSVMNAFLKPNTLMRKAIEETGFASGAAMVKQVGLSGAMKLIGGTSVTASRGIAAVFGRVEALTAVLALSGAQADDWVWKTEAMRNAAGRTDRAFAIQQATVAAMVARIGTSLEVLAVNIGDKLMPMWASFLRWIEENMPTIQEIVLTVVDALVVGLSILAGAIGWAIDKISTAWKILGDLGMQGPVIAAVVLLITAAFVAWGVAAAGAAIGVIAATWPVLAIIAAIAIAIKLLSMVFEHFGIGVEDIFNFLQGIVKAFLQAFLSVAGSIMNVIAQIPGPMQDGANAVRKTIDQMHDDVGRWGTDLEKMAKNAGNIGARISSGLKPDGGPIINQYKATGSDAGAALLEGLKGSLGEGQTMSEAQLEDLGISLDDALAAGINVGEPEVAKAVESLVQRFGTTLKGVRLAAKEAGGDAMAEMAKAITASRTAPKTAMDALIALMKTSLSPMKQVAQDAGILLSKTLAKALKDGRPDVAAQALATVKITADNLAQTAIGGGKAGKAAMKALEKGMRSKSKDVRDASRHAKNVALEGLRALKKPAGQAGSAAATAFGKGLRNGLTALTAQLRLKVQIDGKKFGGYASGSWNIKKNELAFLHQGEMVIPAAAASRLREAATSPGRYGEMAGSSGGGVQNFNITVNPGNDVSRANAQRFGQSVLDVVAGGLREQRARSA